VEAGSRIGKTLVSSSLIDRVTVRLKRRLVEVPVGFKWFVNGLLDGRSVSAEKKALVRRSFVEMDRSGRLTRMASSWIFWPRNDGQDRP